MGYIRDKYEAAKRKLIPAVNTVKRVNTAARNAPIVGGLVSGVENDVNDYARGAAYAAKNIPDAAISLIPGAVENNTLGVRDRLLRKPDAPVTPKRMLSSTIGVESTLAPGFGKIKVLSEAAPVAKLAGYSALRGAEAAVPQFGKDYLDSGLETAKKNFIPNLAAGAAINAVASPRLTATAARDTVRGTVRYANDVASQDAIREAAKVFQADIPDRHTYKVEGVPVDTPTEVRKLSLPPEEAYKVLSGRLDPREVSYAQDYSAPGPRVDISVDVDSGKIHSWDTDNKEFADRINKSLVVPRPGFVDSDLVTGGMASKVRNKKLIPRTDVQISENAGAKEFGSRGTPLEEKLVDNNPELNVNRLNLTPETKQVLSETIDANNNLVHSAKGAPITHEEVIQAADRLAKESNGQLNRDEIVRYQAAMLNTRQKIAAAAEQSGGKMTPELQQALLEDLSQSKFLASSLSNRSIDADGNIISPVRRFIKEISDHGIDIEKVIKEAEGVDFNNANEAAKFYRKYVSPKISNWIDLLRYNSMLSSPNTHINNIFSNSVQSAVVKPIEKTLAGGIDFLASAATGKERQAFAGEGGAYAKGYWSNIGNAAHTFSQVMRGMAETTNLDTRDIKLAPGGGLAGWTEGKLSFPMRLLEGMDQFFTTMAKGGEQSVIDLKASKGVQSDVTAGEKAAYTLFRDAEGKGQNVVLDAFDRFTNTVNSLRNNKNPLVRTVSKFTVPFLRTPMNILKQGIEYSPAGVFTAPGSSNWQEQVAKAAIGSSVFAGAATLLGSGRLTWGEPSSEKQRNAFRAAGMQPYSVKIGDKWVSYSKLGPLAFPMAMVAAIDDAEKNHKLDQSTTEQLLAGVAKFSGFLTDQSYLKSIGDIIDAAKGGESKISATIGNYGQQLIPYRALLGWFARLGDDTQRKVDPQGSFLEKQLQQTLMQIPGLSENVPARLGPDGEPIKNQNNVLNAFSPLKVTTENPDAAETYNAMAESSRTKSMIKQINAKAKQGAINDYSDELEQKKGKAQAAELDDPLYESKKIVQEMPTDQKRAVQALMSEKDLTMSQAIAKVSTDSRGTVSTDNKPHFYGEEPTVEEKKDVQPIDGVKKKGDLYVYQSDGEVKTTQDVRKANKARAIEQVTSGEEDRVDLGDGRVVMAEDNDTGYKVVNLKKVKRDASKTVTKQKIENAKESEDYDTWEKLQKDYMKSLYDEEKTLDPELEADKIATLQAQRMDIAQSISKYRGYGNSFKKPKKPKKPKKINVPNVSVSTSSSRSSSPKIKQIRVK